MTISVAKVNVLSVILATLTVTALMILMRFVLYFFPLVSILGWSAFRVICTLYVAGTIVSRLFSAVRTRVSGYLSHIGTEVMPLSQEFTVQNAKKVII